MSDDSGDDAKERRRLALRQVEALSAEQEGVVSRRQVYAAGISRSKVRANVRARRWAPFGSQSLVLHTGPLPPLARFWAAVFEAGPRAQLDGTSSLIAGGLEHFTEDAIRVSVPRGARVRRASGVVIRQTRRWADDDRHPAGVPRTRNDVAAVRGALWAVSDKQACLVLTMAVQQGMTTAELLGTELLRIRRHRRRHLLHEVVLDLLGGARSLGELEVAAECRRRGLPEPSRQAVRKHRNGRFYLDICWEEWGVVVEVDGVHHTWAGQEVSDALRQNEVTLQESVVLRLPVLGLRIAPDEFFAQIEQALRQAGCPLGVLA